MTSRSVLAKMAAMQTFEGAGFPVRRPFPTARLPMVDPFLVLDHMGPKEWAPGEALGAPDHPHRGFETVTYLLRGEFEHADSAGHRGLLRPGDVQWMTAGAGVVHSEMPSADFKAEGGVLEGFQLWVNLPADEKMTRPHYQEIPKEKLPTARSSDGKVWVRVIAGEALGESAVIDTFTPIAFLHFRLDAGAAHRQPIPSGHNAFIYVISGALEVGHPPERAGEGQIVLLEPDGDDVQLHATDEAADLLLVAGRPLNEPVARYGPFVMTTKEEILQAIDDFQSGRMGRITPTTR